MRKTIIPNILFPESETFLQNLYASFILQTDDLIEQFAPNGWQNSSYFQILNKTIEEHYQDYRYIEDNAFLSVETDQEIPGRPGEYYRKMLDKTNYSLDEFIDRRKWFIAEPRQEFIVILACACSFITDFSKRDVYSNKKHLRYQVREVFFNVRSVYEKAGRDFPKEEDYIMYAIKLFFERYQKYDYCLLPFLELFFEQCKKAGWNWMYLNKQISIYPTLITWIRELSEINPVDNYEAYKARSENINLYKEDLGFVDDYIPSVEEMVEREMALGIPETVIAFKNVYGHYPENYPPTFKKH